MRHRCYLNNMNCFQTSQISVCQPNTEKIISVWSESQHRSFARKALFHGKTFYLDNEIHATIMETTNPVLHVRGCWRLFQPPLKGDTQKWGKAKCGTRSRDYVLIQMFCGLEEMLSFVIFFPVLSPFPNIATCLSLEKSRVVQGKNLNLTGRKFL